MTPEQMRRLAALVDDLEMDGYQVTDAELLARRDDPVAAVELSLSERDGEATAAPGATPAASGMSAFPGRVPASDTEAAVTEEVDDPQEDDGDAPEDREEAVELTDAEQDVVDVLKDDGELPSLDIKRRTERGKYTHKLLSRLRDRGVLEHRKDPADRRRHLYSLAQDGSGGEMAGGGHEAPATNNSGADDLTPAVRPLDGDEWAAISELDQHDQAATDAMQTSGFAADDAEADDERRSDPWVCSCGVACEDRLEWNIHRTEAHGVPQKHHNSLTQGEFLERVRNSDSVTELAASLNVGTEKTLRMLGIYGVEYVGGSLPDDPTASADLLQLGPEAGPGERQRAGAEVSPDA
jgi:hypothetical protein